MIVTKHYLIISLSKIKVTVPHFKSEMQSNYSSGGIIMKNTWKRILAGSLALMLFAVSAPVFAAGSSSAGTEAPEEIEWDGPVLTAQAGVVMGPSGKETYYNLDMSGIVQIMRDMGNTDEYWIREDGCKMLGDYIMCAANLNVHPRGSLVQSSLGMCIVCDTGGFAASNPNQLDIAVNW